MNDFLFPLSKLFDTNIVYAKQAFMDLSNVLLYGTFFLLANQWEYLNLSNGSSRYGLINNFHNALEKEDSLVS
jgi:hypothetical protein